MKASTVINRLPSSVTSQRGCSPKAHISNGVRNLLRQRHGCASQAADAARRRCHNAVAHIKYIYQQVHAIGDTQLCQHKVDKCRSKCSGL